MQKLKSYILSILLLTTIAFLIILRFKQFTDFIIKYDRIILSVAIFILLISLYFQRKQNELYQALKEKQAYIDRDLNMAREIQQSILNKALPQPKGYSLYAICEPAKEIGGDFYGAFQKENLLHFYIGDVTGHGITSALLMSMTNSLLAEISKTSNSPAKILSKLNKALCEQLPKNNINFITIFYCCLNIKNHQLKYCSAGHHPALIFTKNNILPLNTANTLIGMFKENYYQESSFKFQKGNKLLLYTDGILEGRHQKTRQELGENFILNYLKHHKYSGKKLLINLLSSVKKNILEQKDDISIFLLES